jgi:hypothetical protein
MLIKASKFSHYFVFKVCIKQFKIVILVEDDYEFKLVL